MSALMTPIDTHTISISVTGLDLAALRSLSTVNHTLAGQIDYMAGNDLRRLVSVLDQLIAQIAIKISH